MLFVDLIGSTALAEVLSPHEVVRTLNAYFDAVVRVVSEEGGWVNSSRATARCVCSARLRCSPTTRPGRCALLERCVRSSRLSRPRIPSRCRHRCVVGVARGRQRRYGAALRVHADRAPGERSRSPHRSRQGSRRSRARWSGVPPTAPATSRPSGRRSVRSRSAVTRLGRHLRTRRRPPTRRLTRARTERGQPTGGDMPGEFEGDLAGAVFWGADLTGARFAM